MKKWMYWRGHKVQRHWCMKCETQNLIKRRVNKRQWFWFCLNCGYHEHPTAKTVDYRGKPRGRKVDDITQIMGGF